LDPKLISGVALFVLGQALAWFQLNSQFVWEWWQTRPLVAVGIFSIPVGLCFWHGSRLIMESTGELWSARFLAFAASYISFPLLTWWFLNESPLTLKTGVCSLLALTIVLLQIFWR
jgi:hypothetical protein